MKTPILINSTNKNGFTLIEILVVIVILGILAATVAPKFLNFKTDAQTSVLRTVQASIEGAVARAHNKSIVAGTQNQVSSAVTLLAGNIDIVFGYPSETDSIAYWTTLGVIDGNSDISMKATAEGLIFSTNDHGAVSGINDDCIVVYGQAALNTPPTITLNECN